MSFQHFHSPADRGWRRQMAFWRFNATGAVQLYEAFIPTLQEWTNIATGIDLGVGIFQAGDIAVQLCPAVQAGCTGANQVYNDILVSIVMTSYCNNGRLTYDSGLRRSAPPQGLW